MKKSSSTADSRKLFEYVVKECRLDPNHTIVRRALEAISAGRSSHGPPLFTMEEDGERVHFKVTDYGRQALLPPDVEELNAELVAFMAEHTPDEARAQILEDLPSMTLEKAQRVLELVLSLPLLAGESWKDRGEVIALARSVVEMKKQEADQRAKPWSSRRPVRRRR